MDGDVFVVPWYPEGVQYILTTGSHHYIGFIDDSAVLKYPHFKEPSISLQAESKILQRLAKHPRIIHFKGDHADGELLEYAPGGSLAKYLKDNQVSLKEKIRLAKETAEGLAYAHERNVLICDIHIRNILLDAELHVKLCDFQGRMLDSKGEVIVDGGASENAESFKPRCDEESADVSTDLFALGSTIYHIVTGHRPYPQYDTIDDEAKFEELYRKGYFPALDEGSGGVIVRKCWEGRYNAASEAMKDLEVLEDSL